ncbi:hypothetical protein TNCV_2629541 [Trichonephila clavipes]|uniref:Uncharacterized protein n=1 Tax=Trichonephila clavipes TaxID=2585209 RepID=A0A8X6SFJ3_TRICX|nr:hypothetical protein TNCV_2629541 [Trichonephila clavipes]
MYNLFTEHSKNNLTSRARLCLLLQSGPSKPVIRMSFPDESIRIVGKPDSRKPFSPTSSEHSPQHAGHIVMGHVKDALSINLTLELLAIFSIQREFELNEIQTSKFGNGNRH